MTLTSPTRRHPLWSLHSVVLAASIALSLSAGTPSARAEEATSEAAPIYDAKVRRGPHGVAHISADDYGSLGYGEAYAAAEDHVCVIAYGLLEARGEKARYFGPGPDNGNVAADAVVRALDVHGQAREAFAAQTREDQSWIEGYTAGYNRYLREHQGARNNSWCSGADWLVEASVQDIMARTVLLALTLPRMTAALASTRPPSRESRGTTDLAALEDALAAAALSDMGSNGWALGRERTENGRGILLANPHYPWYGGSRFWEKHLTIPGRIDQYGVGLLGVPGIAIGFNEHLGWTHTVSASQRVVLYRLHLDPENPMRYRYGDEWRQIEAREVDVPLPGNAGTHTHTVYFSHYGPVVTLPNMAWDERFAYAARDANAGNYRILSQWKAMGSATSMDEFIDAHRKGNAMPWVNTIAASHDGRAVYLDNSTVGNLSEEAQEAWSRSLETDRLAAGLFQQRRMILLDGSDPANEWIEVPSAPLTGTAPFEARPRIERSDYVFNANDSYWLSNPDEPLTGASILYGPTETARSLRTRMNVRMLTNHYGDAGEEGRFTIREVQEALFANRGFTAEVLLPDLLDACRDVGDELADACAVLSAYDGTLNLDSPGAVLFREWITRYRDADMVAAGPLFREPFRVDDPVETPARLGNADEAMNKLAAAVAILEAADLPLDATLRDAQFAWRAGEAIPVHGGNRFEGVANLQIAGNPSASPIAGVSPATIGDSRNLTDAGYPVVHGSSFILTLGFDDEGPVAEALLSYSQSGNPRSPHFRDQTDLYARKSWRKVAFHETDVAGTATSQRILRSIDER